MNKTLLKNIGIYAGILLLFIGLDIVDVLPEGDASEVKDGANDGTYYYHGMQAYETTFEEVAQCEALAVIPMPTVVIGITDDETREHEKEVHAQMSMIEGIYATTLGKGKSLENVIEKYKNRGHATQTVKQFIMRFCIGKIHR